MPGYSSIWRKNEFVLEHHLENHEIDRNVIHIMFYEIGINANKRKMI